MISVLRGLDAVIKLHQLYILCAVQIVPNCASKITKHTYITLCIPVIAHLLASGGSYMSWDPFYIPLMNDQNLVHMTSYYPCMCNNVLWPSHSFQLPSNFGFPHTLKRAHGSNGLKFGMLMYPDHHWLDYGHGLMITGIRWKTHGRDDLKFGMLMYPDYLQNW